MIRTYSELIKLKTFEERFEYLKLPGTVAHETFGYDRYMNQIFYQSKEWRAIRDSVIIRDCGCDLACEGYEIGGSIYIHHMNPIQKEDIEKRTRYLLDPEFLICVSFATHNAIHYGDLLYLKERQVIERRPNDQCPWKH